MALWLLALKVVIDSKQVKERFENKSNKLKKTLNTVEQERSLGGKGKDVMTRQGQF
jgi:hypothetical protein